MTLLGVSSSRSVLGLKDKKSGLVPSTSNFGKFKNSDIQYNFGLHPPEIVGEIERICTEGCWDGLESTVITFLLGHAMGKGSHLPVTHLTASPCIFVAVSSQQQLFGTQKPPQPSSQTPPPPLTIIVFPSSTAERPQQGERKEMGERDK